MSDLPTLPHPSTHHPASIFSLRSPFPNLKKSCILHLSRQNCLQSLSLPVLKGREKLVMGKEYMRTTFRTPLHDRIIMPFVFPTLKYGFSFLWNHRNGERGDGERSWGGGEQWSRRIIPPRICNRQVIFSFIWPSEPKQKDKTKLST